MVAALAIGLPSGVGRSLTRLDALVETLRRHENGVDEDGLLEAVGRGDGDAALHTLYERYVRRIYGLGLRLLGDAGLAEELVQETFLRLWRTASRFDPGRGSAQAFIYAIARRLAIDLWRRPSSRALLPEAEENVDPETTIDRVLLQLSVREALDSLSDAHREVLELSYRGDRTQAQIAGRLGISVGTVKSRTFHALRLFHRAAEEHGLHG